MSKFRSPRGITLHQSFCTFIWAPAWPNPTTNCQKVGPHLHRLDMQASFATTNVAPEVVSPAKHRCFKVGLRTPRRAHDRLVIGLIFQRSGIDVVNVTTSQTPPKSTISSRCDPRSAITPKPVSRGQARTRAAVPFP